MPDSPAFTIRRATPMDAAAIVVCLHAAFEPYRDAYTPEAYLDTVMSDETVAQRFAEMAVFVAASASGEILDTVGGHRFEGEDGHIRGMAVRPDLRGSGVAQVLLETVEAELRAQGCARATLDTTAPLERAMRFYERNGYRRTGVVRDFFGMPLFEFAKRLESA